MLGAVFAPALGCPFAGAVGYGAFIEDQDGGGPSPVAFRPKRALTVVASRSHWRCRRARCLSRRAQGGRTCAARDPRSRSASSQPVRRIGIPASDERWNRLPPPASAVPSAAGGCLTTVMAARLTYGKPGFANPHLPARASRREWPCGRRALRVSACGGAHDGLCHTPLPRFAFDGMPIIGSASPDRAGAGVAALSIPFRGRRPVSQRA